MPICKRDGFDNSLSARREDSFHDNEDVFYCDVTKEIFRTYEDYFRHVMVINSTVWQCEATGRENLTYIEALKSERRARKKMDLFKHTLRAPVMLVIEHAKQSSLNALCAIASKFLRRRFFLQEEVTACHISSTYNAYAVVGISHPEKTISTNMLCEETEKLLYKLRRIGHAHTEVTVPFENIRRQRSEFTSENLQLFVKNNVTRVEGILRPKPESYKKYVNDPKITYASIFIGKIPYFTPAKIRNQDEKKQLTINNYLIKNGDDKNLKLTAEELAKREKEKSSKAEAKAKSLKEEMERLRREKQERLLELERQKVERRIKLMARIEEECTALLTKTDDLERTDQRLLPTYTPIQTYISTKLLSDVFVLREFMHSFVGVLSGMEVFRGNISFYEMSRAFTAREVAGPLSDILLIFLGTIFDLQKEEEEECAVEYLIMRKESLRREPFITMSQAARAHFFAKRHFSARINELPIDALTLSEVLRLHLLSSGAIVKDRAEKWRLMYRNGYTSSEDPGLAMRMQHPHILRALKMHTIYQLPFVDIARVLRCLMAQILTYSNPINIIEERMEEMAKARLSLRSLTATENMRLSSVQAQKRTLTNEYNQQCIEKDVKSDLEKKQQLEDKLNKKIAEILAQSDREHKKYEQEVTKLNAALFNFLVYLGMDRAYRKYYVLESMPGIFVEHPRDCMDCCLSNPPKNVLPEELNAKLKNLPKTRKELRAYLLRTYTEEEKKAAMVEKPGSTNNKKISASQENKENQEIQQNLVLNGIGLDPKTGARAAVDEDIVDVDEVEVPMSSSDIESVVLPPTQRQLYMCTGDSRNCIVHDERNTGRQHWAYLYEAKDIETLIACLNPLGERESQLRERLTVLRELILNHVKTCPVEMLSLEKKEMNKFKNLMMTDTHRKYSKSNFGFSEDTDLNKVMHAVLIDRILQFENDIYFGDLGRLKVEDLKKWRDDLQNNTYDPQGKLQWGETLYKPVGAENEDALDEMDENDLDVDDKKYSNKPYKDPGESLGESMQIDSEDSEDDEISLHDSPTTRTSVRHLASALLQVEQGIGRRFIKEPFGAPLKEPKDKELLERKLKWGADRLKQWEVSLMECTGYAQVFLHLNILHDSIVWARSTNKSSCQVCRRGSDPDKMLLCDECNGGTHMFCMKPKMKTVPEGNWYCQRCVNRLGLKNEANDIRKKITRRVDQRKQLRVNDIEEMLQDDYSGNEEEELVEAEEEGVFDTEETEEEVNSRNDDDEETDGDSDQDEDTLVCTVCSYDGSDLICVRCKDPFHLECIKLKRLPRYNFVCPKCKSNDEEKKRKLKEDDDFVGDDDDTGTHGPRSKRLRPQRSSLRNSLPEVITQDQTKNNFRRSNRRTGDNLPLNSSALYKLLEDIMKHEQAWPFLRPVMQSEVPDYYKIIKNPMDFAKVKSKLNMGDYQLNEELMSDIQLIFSNCDKYNVKGNEIYQAGSTLEKYVLERCRDLHLPFKPSDMNE